MKTADPTRSPGPINWQAAAYPRPSTQSRHVKPSGFSLIEMMIVLAIFGIIMAVGFPNYLDYIRDSRRSDAHLVLMSAVQALERCRSTRFSYDGCTLPTHLQTSEGGDYAITLVSDASTYTLTATAQEKQAADTDCATITINDQAVKGPTDGDCWD